MVRVHIFFVMMIANGATNKYGSKIGKNICLNECYQNFNNIYKYRESDRNRGKCKARGFAHFTKNKYKADEAEDDDVPCRHISEQTHNKGKWLGKYAQQLHRYH